uniref:Uncharacterized protein n=1 Tax=Ulva partita TaxID=1605170 RepID=A0A1C9ZS33_9CHLO|nr:hypothetical protein [Ulva partita]
MIQHHLGITQTSQENHLGAFFRCPSMPVTSAPRGVPATKPATC